MSEGSAWQATSAWPAPVPGELARSFGDGLRIERLENLHAVSVIAREGREAELGRCVRDRLGCDLPERGRVAFADGIDIAWSAPGQWLVVGRKRLTSLREALGAVAAVTDQGDGRAFVQIAGRHAREVLAKGFAIDLHPSVFTTGSTAATKVAHLSVQIWQTDEAPSFTIAVPRSFASTFWSWLRSAGPPGS